MTDTDTIFLQEITRDYDDGFYGYFSPTPGISPLTGPYQMSIANHEYLADLSFKPYRRDAYRMRSQPNVRDSLNIDNVPGLGVLDPSGMWRRDAIDWSLGAGQLFFDHRKSVDNRFYESKGVDPFTNQWQLSLLPDTAKTFTLKGSGTFVKPLVVGQYRYYMEQDTICYEDVSAVGTYHTLASLPSTGSGHYFSDICANGEFVFVAAGTGGIYYWPIADHATSPTHYVIQTSATSTGEAGFTFTKVAWAADVLWATGEQYVYVFGASLNGATAAPHSSGSAYGAGELIPDVVGQGRGGNWRWTNIVEGNSQIYLGGYYESGTLTFGGAIYRIGQVLTPTVSGATTTTSTTYAAPVRSLQLTPGETPSAVLSYLNFIFVGTSLGVRMCRTLSQYDPTATATGDLEAGALIPNVLQPVTSNVSSFTAQGRWVYFAWANYDTGSTGIGRLDVQNFIDDLTPAYCSHLMATAQSTDLNLAWDTVTDQPMIAVSNPTTGDPGVYTATDELVESGYVDSGWTTWQIADDKAIIKGHFSVGQAAGALKMFVTYDDSEGTIHPFVEVHGENAGSDDMGRLWFLADYLRGNKFRFKVELDRDSLITSNGPVLSSWTMWGQPIYVASETEISAVIDLFREITVEDAVVRQDPYAEFMYLDTIRREQLIVPYVEGPISAQVFITSIDWLPEQPQGGYTRGFQSACVVYMQTINGFTYTPEPTT